MPCRPCRLLPPLPLTSPYTRTLPPPPPPRTRPAPPPFRPCTSSAGTVPSAPRPARAAGRRKTTRRCPRSPPSSPPPRSAAGSPHTPIAIRCRSRSRAQRTTAPDCPWPRAACRAPASPRRYPASLLRRRTQSPRCSAPPPPGARSRHPELHHQTVAPYRGHERRRPRVPCTRRVVEPQAHADEARAGQPLVRVREVTAAAQLQRDPGRREVLHERAPGALRGKGRRRPSRDPERHDRSPPLERGRQGRVREPIVGKPGGLDAQLELRRP